MLIPFLKAHGAGNDFLFSFADEIPPEVEPDLFPDLARDICARHSGVGADGWYRIGPPAEGCDATLELYNSDGTKAELSGNGTRCAAAILVDSEMAESPVRILTGSGPRTLTLTDRQGREFHFDMDMGRPVYEPDHLRFPLPLESGARTVTILDVGNPQCAVIVDTLDFDWRTVGAEIEGHPRFPRRTNVSFVRRLNLEAIEVRFWERGAGATLSSGTGSVGAAAAAILLGLTDSPVRVVTEAGDLQVDWPDLAGSATLTGPAQITASGDFFW
jgi:diaminopimelate epimerase